MRAVDAPGECWLYSRGHRLQSHQTEWILSDCERGFFFQINQLIPLCFNRTSIFYLSDPTTKLSFNSTTTTRERKKCFQLEKKIKETKKKKFSTRKKKCFEKERNFAGRSKEARFFSSNLEITFIRFYNDRPVPRSSMRSSFRRSLPPSLPFPCRVGYLFMRISPKHERQAEGDTVEAAAVREKKGGKEEKCFAVIVPFGQDRRHVARADAAIHAAHARDETPASKGIFFFPPRSCAKDFTRVGRGGRGEVPLEFVPRFL